MKVTADRRALHAAFQHVGGIITSTIARPIYQNVKFEALGDSVYLSATDLEVGLRLKVDKVQVEEEGCVLLPEGRITPLLGATLDESVSLEGDETAVTLRSSDGRFRILSEDAADFADIPALSGEAVLEIDPEVLRWMVQRTTFATADEKGRFALNGVLIAVGEDGTFEMVAADGSRLAQAKRKADNPAGRSIECILMKKGIEQAAQLGMLSEQPLRVEVTDTQFLAENDVGRTVSQLVEGQFPNFREVVPRDCKTRADVPTKPLLNAVRRAAFLTSEQTRAVDFTFSKGLLVLSSQSPDLGEAEVRVPVDYEGEEAAIAFNPRYLEQVLQVVERETVRVEFNDRRSPCLVRAGVDYLYVLSPVVREEPEG